ncbi:hypothetical protein HK100_005010 [Physocladia obscura]|uniref:Uncharacterized protein n=1 Tax=Physocladia obscura TaxID=109957 RepID=A0AAD5TBX8_9FUNG|nr:hypothetical protein HK100_005010 [Physocladia obscura]
MPKKPKRKPLATLTNNPHRPFTFTYALAQPGLMRTIALRWPKSWRGSLPAKSELPKPKPKPNPKPNPKPLSSASSLRMRYFDENGTSLTVATSSSSVTPWIPPPIYPQLSTSNSAETAETTSSVALNSKTSASTVSKIFSDPLLLLRNLHSDSQTAKRVKFADEENMFLSNDDDDDFNYDKDHYHVVTHDSIDFIYSSNSIGAAKAENDNENENENNDDFVIVREEKIRPTINFRKEKLEAQFLEDSDYDGNGIDEDFDAEEDEDEVDILAAILSYKNVYSLEGENK